MGKTRKGRGGRVEMYDKEKKRPRTPKTSKAGQKLWCEKCRAKGSHGEVSDVVKCFGRHVIEGHDFFWVRA